LNFSTDQTATTVVDRSPYGYTHLELLNDLFLPVGFVTVGQDMRGTEMSEGNFSIWHSDGNDSQDLGNWIVQQPWSDGNIFSFGVSADGLAAFTMVSNVPAWLGAQYFIWASSTGYDVIFPNGAYLVSLADLWIRSTVPYEADADLQIIRENEMRSAWWLPLDLKGNFSSVRGRGGFWAGWYDVFLVGNLVAYEGYNYEADPSVRYSSMLTVDPLGHCQEAAVYFPQNLIEGRTALALVQALETFGVAQVQRSNIKNVTFYVMSSNDQAGLSVGQYWTSLEHFPTPTSTHWYLHGDGSASKEAPAEGEVESSWYVHDPTDPVPTMGGNNLQLPCGPLDQAMVDARGDVLLFQTEVLEEPLFLTGPIFATLFVGSSAVDTDFMVRKRHFKLL
jgi:predicted acyl esterase